MKFLIVVAAFAAVVYGASQPESAQECKDTLDAAFSAPDSSPDSRCEALVEYSKCLGGFPRDEELEEPLVSEQSKFCETYWNKVEAPSMRVVRGNMVMTVDDAMDIEFHRHRRETVNVFTMKESIDKLTEAVSTLTATVEANKLAHDEALNNTVEMLRAEQKKLEDQINATLEDMKEDTVMALEDLGTESEKKIDALDDKLTKELDKAEQDLSELSTSVDKDLSDLSTSVNKGLQDAEKDLEDNVKALETKITNPRKYMWSGGPKSHRRGNGWAEITLDRVEFDKAAPFFKKDTATRFRALKAGLFKITAHLIAHGNWCWRHMAVYVNNQQIIQPTHQYANSWNGDSVELTWQIPANQQFWVSAYTSCSNPYTWHSGYYTRVQVSYEGQLS